MESVFCYLDYRDFLKDHYSDAKRRHSYFSFRYVSAKTGIDASFYVKVINKQKHISEKRLVPLLDFLKLSPKERDYFAILVQYNRTKNRAVEKELFSKLMTLKNGSGELVENFSYFAKWYTIPVRELLSFYHFNGDYEALAAAVTPPITAAEAKGAIKTLRSLKMVKKDEKGFLRPSDAIVTTGDQWQSIAISQFQKKMIDLAQEAVDTLPKEKRDISTLTVSTSQACLELIREKLAITRKEILEMVAREEEVDAVYQINLQVFPLTSAEVKK